MMTDDRFEQLRSNYMKRAGLSGLEQVEILDELATLRRETADWERRAKDAVRISTDALAHKDTEIEDWRRRWQNEDDAARYAREALQVEREEWRQEREALEIRLELATRLAEDADKHRSEAMAELARLKPSGRVAEDVAELEESVRSGDPKGFDVATAALTRLAAKAQGYETADGERVRMAAENERLHLLLASTEKERDVAVAGNAALVREADGPVARHAQARAPLRLRGQTDGARRLSSMPTSRGASFTSRRRPAEAAPQGGGTSEERGRRVGRSADKCAA